MRTKHVYIFISLFLIIACNSYKPFASLKDKKSNIQLIKSKLDLSNAEFKKIQKEDSILFSVSKALRNNVKHDLVKRRLDSFFVDNYTKRELLTILILDYNFRDKKRPFEINRRKNAQGIEFKNIDEIKKFFSPDGKFEKDMEGMLGKKKDSTNSKKKKN